MLNTQAWGGASFFVRSFRVGCAVTQAIAGKHCGDIGDRELAVEDIERRYVRGAKTARDHIGTTLDIEEARFVAGYAYALVASAHLAVWTICLTRPTYPRSLPTTDCMRRFTPTVFTSIRAS